MEIVIYQKPTCTTCRQVHAALKKQRKLDAVNYYVDPIPKKKLLELLRKMKMTAREVLRTKEPVYKTLLIAERDLSDDEIVEPDRQEPRPDSAADRRKGARAILARPAARLEGYTVIAVGCRFAPPTPHGRESSCRSSSSAPAASSGNATDNHRGMHRHC